MAIWPDAGLFAALPVATLDLPTVMKVIEATSVALTDAARDLRRLSSLPVEPKSFPR